MEEIFKVVMTLTFKHDETNDPTPASWYRRRKAAEF